MPREPMHPAMHVRAQGVFEDDDSIHLVMELCEGGGILDRMKSRGR